MSWWEKLMLTVVAWLPKVKAWADVDSDGDVDGDDLKAIYGLVHDTLLHAEQHFDGWGAMTLGARIDAVVSFVKETFPGASSKLIALLETIAWIAQVVKGLRT